MSLNINHINPQMIQAELERDPLRTLKVPVYNGIGNMKVSMSPTDITLICPQSGASYSTTFSYVESKLRERFGKRMQVRNAANTFLASWMAWCYVHNQIALSNDVQALAGLVLDLHDFHKSLETVYVGWSEESVFYEDSSVVTDAGPSVMVAALSKMVDDGLAGRKEVGGHKGSHGGQSEFRRRELPRIRTQYSR